MFSHDFKNDLNLLLEKIKSKEPFAFARYADGELAIIQNKKIMGCDGWRVTDEDILFGQDLLETFKHSEDNYLYGISCPCCDYQAYSTYKKLVGNNWSRTTFSNLFVNSNWNDAFSFFMNYPNKIFICNENAKLDFPFYKVPNDVLLAYRNSKEQLKNMYESIAEKHEKTLFLISAGPLSELIINWMYCKNPNNQYIDIGSCLDLFIHKKPTRVYHFNGSDYSLKTCTFGEN